MISKELLSKVLELNIILVDTKYTESTNKIRYVTNDKNDYYINIYELAHKCKEWAFRQGYELRNGRDIDVKEELCYFCEYKQERQLDYSNGDYFLADNENESIFKACQWILNNNSGSSE